MSRIKNFTNGGSLTNNDLNNIQDDYEKTYNTIKEVFYINSVLTGLTGAGIYVMLADGSATQYDTASAPLYLAAFGLSGTNFGDLVAYPPGFTVNGGFVPYTGENGGRSVFVRVAGSVVTNATSPGVNLTFSLCKVTSVSTLSAGTAATGGLGAALATASVTAPLASTTTFFTGSEVQLDGADTGMYVVKVLAASSQTGGSKVSATVRVQVRNV